MPRFTAFLYVVLSNDIFKFQRRDYINEYFNHMTLKTY